MSTISTSHNVKVKKRGNYAYSKPKKETVERENKLIII